MAGWLIRYPQVFFKGMCIGLLVIMATLLSMCSPGIYKNEPPEEVNEKFYPGKILSHIPSR